MIDKWLKAGVLEEGRLHRPTHGSPQGGVISPCLSNIFLPHVLDEWFEHTVKPRLKGKALLVRYALVMAFFRDAKRVQAVLGKRLIDFRFRRPTGACHPAAHGTTFDFLGFTHVWSKSWKGSTVVRQVTAKDRYARALAAITEWCRTHRHRPIMDQHAYLSAMLWGHYAYYGVTGNSRRWQWYAHRVVRIWQKWLSRRDRQSAFTWRRLNELLKRHPLPPARIVHRYATVSETLS
jgi:RNA-directed DNA polymerase